MSGRGKQHQVRENGTGDKARKPFWRRARSLGGMVFAGVVFALFAVGLFANFFPMQASAAQDPGGGSNGATSLEAACKSLGGALSKDNVCTIGKSAAASAPVKALMKRANHCGANADWYGPNCDNATYTISGSTAAGYGIRPSVPLEFGGRDKSCNSRRAGSGAGTCTNGPADMLTAINAAIATANDPTNDHSTPSKGGSSGGGSSAKICYNQDDGSTVPPGKDGKCPAGTSENKPTPATTCAVTGVGWIVCPVVRFLAGAADMALKALTGLMTINPSMFAPSKDGNGAYEAYQRMLPIANTMLVIVFLILIYSEAVGAEGVMSNYNIKKTLPRLVVFAILINIAWYICAAAVDLSNIFGANSYSFFKSIDINKGQQPSGQFSGGGSWALFGGTILAGVGIAAGAIMLLTGMLGSILLAVVLLVAAIIFILTVRNVAIVLLCVISPLAFAAYILPNTQSWFKKWWKMFSSLLLLYPTIALIYGASNLGSRVMSASGNIGGDGGWVGWIQKIMVAAMPVIPLIATPMVLKGALNGLGKIGGAITSQSLGRSSKHLSSSAKQSVGDSMFGSAWGTHKQKQLSRRNTMKARQGKILSHTGFKDTAAKMQGAGRAEQNKQDQAALEEADGFIQQTASKMSQTQIQETAKTGVLNGQKLTGAQYAAFLKDKGGDLNKTERTKAMEFAGNQYKGDENANNRIAMLKAIEDSGGSWAGGGDAAKFKKGQGVSASTILQTKQHELERNAKKITAEKAKELDALYGDDTKAQDAVISAFSEANSASLTFENATSLVNDTDDEDTRAMAEFARYTRKNWAQDTTQPPAKPTP